MLGFRALRVSADQRAQTCIRTLRVSGSVRQHLWPAPWFHENAHSGSTVSATARPTTRRASQLATSRAAAGLEFGPALLSRGCGSGVPRCRSAPEARSARARPARGIPGSSAVRGEQYQSQLRAPAEPAGVRPRSVAETLLGASWLAQARIDEANHTTAAAARTHGADPLPDRSLTGRACLIVVQAFPVG